MAGKIRVGIIGASAHYGWSRRAHLPARRAGMMGRGGGVDGRLGLRPAVPPVNRHHIRVLPRQRQRFRGAGRVIPQADYRPQPLAGFAGSAVDQLGAVGIGHR